MTINGLEGKRFGDLVVLNKRERDWECKCDCGEKCYILAKQLMSGHKKSCGCRKRPNLIGKKFNRLIVTKLVGTKNGKRIWECKCDCGNIRTAIHSKLTNGSLQSCGCKKREDMLKRQWKGHGEISGSLWTRIVNQAKSRNLDVTVTIEDIWNLFLEQNRKCKLTNLPLVFSSKYWATDGTASLDRINSELGYIKGNLQWVHKDINQMKSNFSEEYFFGLCRKVVEINNKRK